MHVRTHALVTWGPSVPAHSKDTWILDFRPDGRRGGSRRREEDPVDRERERTTMAGRGRGEERRERGERERERFVGTVGKGGLLS